MTTLMDEFEEWLKSKRYNEYTLDYQDAIEDAQKKLEELKIKYKINDSQKL